MLLSDVDIKTYINMGMLTITGEYTLNNCSVDLGVNLNKKTILIEPDDFFLLKTDNWIMLPNDIAGILGGRSYYARKGLIIHCTSALIAPGFYGKIVLEVKNIGNNAIRLYDKEKICSLSFAKMLTPCSEPYNGRYQGQV